MLKMNSRQLTYSLILILCTTKLCFSEDKKINDIDFDKIFGNRLPSAQEAIKTIHNVIRPVTPVSTDHHSSMPESKPTEPTATAKPDKIVEEDYCKDLPFRKTILFNFDSSTIKKKDHDWLDLIAQIMNDEKYKGCNFKIEGHTDATGTPEYNQILSEERALSVLSFLSRHTTNKVNSGRMKSTGVGEDDLIDPKNPEDEINRTVRIYFVDRIESH